ncbi:hypothetical protein L249_1000, partial [Ophiocordyceps polyrhachis-furcata BCC 54312]
LHFGGSARHSHTHTQGTRPEGLGGSRDAGPAAAGPRPPYVTAAEQHNNVGGGYGYGYGTATLYSGYGRTGRTGRTKEGTRRLRLRLWHGYAVQRLRPYGPYGPYEGRNPIKAIAAAAAAAAADPEGLFDYRLLRGGEDEGPALADLETFFLPIAGELTADSTLFFFDLSGSYGYSKRPRTGSGSGSGSGSGLAAEYGYGPGIAVIIAVTIAVITALEKHAFLCRKIGSSYGPGPGPGPGPDESIEHSYGLFQALPKEIQV